MSVSLLKPPGYLPAQMFPDRPWGPGNNPKTAVHEYLKTHAEFEIDKRIQHQLLIMVAPDGYLRRKNTDASR